MKKTLKHASDIGVSSKTINLLGKFLKTMGEYEVKMTLNEIRINHEKGRVILYDW